MDDGSMDIIIIAQPQTEIRPSWSGNSKKFTDLLLSNKSWKFEDKLDEELKAITKGEHVKKT